MELNGTSWCGRKELRVHDYGALDSASLVCICWLCVHGQVTESLCALISSSVKWISLGTCEAQWDNTHKRLRVVLGALEAPNKC